MSDLKKQKDAAAAITSLAVECARESHEYYWNDEEYRQPIAELRVLRDRAGRRFHEIGRKLSEVAKRLRETGE